MGAAIFAEKGHKVVGVDINAAKIAKIEHGFMPIYEPGLDKIVLDCIKNKTLKFTTSIKEGIAEAEVVFICVGTPQGDTGAADLSAVWAVAKEIGKTINGYKVVVTKSTVPVGTNERVYKIIREFASKGTKFDVGSNPEFLREGYAVEDMREPDRTVIGSNSARALAVLKKLYGDQKTPVLECNLRTAEMIKYASNAFLAAKISFINELGQLCERANSDIIQVAKGMGLDKRIGPRFLNAGIGYGGSCFPKDVAALYRTSTDQAYDFKLLRAVMEVNEQQRFNFMRKITKYFGQNLSGKTFAVLGLAFKENTDDIRESVAIKMVSMLRGAGASMRVYDQAALENTRSVLGNVGVYYANDIYDAMKGAHALCVFTEWNEFRDISAKKAKKLLKSAVVFDGRNVLNQKDFEDVGFTFFAVGRRTNGYTEDGEISSGGALLKNGNGK